MLLCRGSPEETFSGSVPVYLNVYDLTSANGYAYWVGLGVYHSGDQGLIFRKSMQIGKTDLGPVEVRAVMEELSDSHRGNTYHLITKNCNHLCNDACIRLARNPIPSWVNCLARIGFFCNRVLPASLCSSKVQHHKMEEKVLVEEERTMLTDGGVVRCATKNSSSSPPSNSCRGRSRSWGRREQTPSPSAANLRLLNLGFA